MASWILTRHGSLSEEVSLGSTGYTKWMDGILSSRRREHGAQEACELTWVGHAQRCDFGHLFVSLLSLVCESQCWMKWACLSRHCLRFYFFVAWFPFPPLENWDNHPHRTIMKIKLLKIYAEAFRTVLGTKKACILVSILMISVITTGQEEPHRYGPKPFIHSLLLKNVAIEKGCGLPLSQMMLISTPSSNCMS